MSSIAATTPLPHASVEYGASVWQRHAVPLGMFLIGAVVFVNEAVFRFSRVEQFAFDWQIAMRLALCGCCGLYGFAHRQHWVHWQRFPAALAAVFVAWTVITVPFSVSLNYSAASSAALICMALFAPAVLCEIGGRRFSLSLYGGLVVYLLGSWIAHFLVPELGAIEVDGPGIEYRARMGGLNSSNTTGRLAAAALALSAALGVAGTLPRRWLMAVAALALVTLVATDSRTSMLMGMAACAVIVAERIGRRNTITIVVVGLLAASIAALLLANGPPGVSADAFFSKFSRTGEAEEIYHMTGRVELWDFVLACIRSSPIFGYGWGCTRFLLIDGHFATHHAHNVILNITLGGGVLAGGLVAATLLALALRGVSEPNLFPDMVATLICVGGVADAVMLNPVPDSHTLMWLAALHWRTVVASLRHDETQSDGTAAADSAVAAAETTADPWLAPDSAGADLEEAR